MALAIWTFVLLGLLFGVVVFVGAPYLPTLSPQVATALDLLDLRPGQTLLELGCGDGKVLIEAANRGVRAIGIEINPILVLVALVRTYRHRDMIKVRWGNFWSVKWPENDGVFVFLIDRFMPELDKHMKECGGKLASVAFRVPGKEPTVTRNGVYLYDYGKVLA